MPLAHLRYMVAHPLSILEGVEECFHNIRSKCERKLLFRVVIVYTENASELLSVRRGLKNKSIILKTSPPYANKSNGLAERFSRTLLVKVRAMLKHAALPGGFEGDSVKPSGKSRQRYGKPTLAYKHTSRSFIRYGSK